MADMPEDQRRAFLVARTSEEDKEKGYRILGGKARKRIMAKLPALGSLVDAVQNKVRGQGWIRGIDGRRLPIRKAHAALNTLLQSAGALVMKKALVLMDAEFRKRGWVKMWDPYNGDLFFVANIHDEVQIEVKEEITDEVSNIAAEAIRCAGEYFQFRCELAGNSAAGRNWCETH